MDPRAGLDGRKISHPPGFDPRTVQPVAQSLYRLSYPAHILYEVKAQNETIYTNKYICIFCIYKLYRGVCDELITHPAESYHCGASLCVT